MWLKYLLFYISGHFFWLFSNDPCRQGQRKVFDLSDLGHNANELAHLLLLTHLFFLKTKYEFESHKWKHWLKINKIKPTPFWVSVTSLTSKVKMAILKGKKCVKMKNLGRCFGGKFRDITYNIKHSVWPLKGLLTSISFNWHLYI